jgi:hypothetical protein
MHLTIFSIIVTIQLLFWAILWSRAGFVNVFVKIMFLLVGIWGVVEILIRFGYIIKI